MLKAKLNVGLRNKAKDIDARALASPTPTSTSRPASVAVDIAFDVSQARKSGSAPARQGGLDRRDILALDDGHRPCHQ
jgi:hypothetical protein